MKNLKSFQKVQLVSLCVIFMFTTQIISGQFQVLCDNVVQINTTNSFGYMRIGSLNDAFAHFYTNLPRYYFDEQIVIGTGRLSSYNNHKLFLQTHHSQVSSEVVRILSNKRVGINCYSIGDPQYTLDVNGTVRCNSIEYSDERYKTKIKDIKKERISDLLLLEGKQYNYKKVNEIFNVEEIQDSASISTEEPFIDTLTHFGLLAQDVQLYFPELVQADAEGFLGLNYTGLIPVIIEVLKQQQSEIDKLKIKIKEKDQQLAKVQANHDQAFSLKNSAILHQNAPNPFNKDTRISFYIPGEMSSAVLYIYDLQGKQIKSVNIIERENGEIVITAMELDPGIYFYSLIADGHLIGTKQMVLTD